MVRVEVTQILARELIRRGLVGFLVPPSRKGHRLSAPKMWTKVSINKTE